MPKRFYKQASSQPRGEMFEVLLDDRNVKTPKRVGLMLPTLALAGAIAEEWAQQGERVDPASMPLTQLANTAIDGVAGREAEVRADILKYAGSDLLCYRAEAPAALIERQAAAWDSVLDWAETVLGARFILAKGVMPVTQPDEALRAVAANLDGLDAFRLASVHVMTTLVGSAVLALAHARGRLTAAEAWKAAHVDEDWQIEQWGEDPEAAARRRRHWDELRAASRLLQLMNRP